MSDTRPSMLAVGAVQIGRLRTIRPAEGNLEGLRLGHRPMIDLKHVLVIVNKGSFKGYEQFLGKASVARNMATWYYSKNYQAIE